MTESEKVICKMYLEDLDRNHSCNEYKLLMGLLEQESCEDCISREDALMCLTGEYEPDKEYTPEEIIAKHVRRIKALPPIRPYVPESEDSISRNCLMKHLHECKTQSNGLIQAVVVAIESFVEQMPPVQPTRRKGKWINTAPPGRNDNIVCDQCGYNSIANYDFCPKCGADMKGEQKMMTKPTGGCIKCAKCESVRQWYYCGQTKLTDKQLYNTKGCCKKFIPKASIKETEQNNETDSLEKALDGFKAFADYMWGKQKENPADHIMQRFMRKE